MKIWHMHRTDQGGYDTYDSCVVVATTKEEALLIHPGNDDLTWNGKVWAAEKPDAYAWTDDTWTAPENLIVREIGTANEGEKGCICASFNAG